MIEDALVYILGPVVSVVLLLGTVITGIIYVIIRLFMWSD